jgi:CheY-like chemotaxis protein
MAKVLVIEDEAVLRSSVARGIAKLGTEVLEAANLNDALLLLDRSAPDLVVSDIDMPERSGIELVGELGRRGLKIPIVFVSGYLHAYRAQIPHHASIEVLEKPVPIDELRAVVARRLGDSGLKDVSPFSVPDYLQLACMGRHSVLIEVEQDGRVLGEVVVCRGDLWSAKDERGLGLDALGRLTCAEGALTRCKRLHGDPPPRDLEGSWEFLLMEAVRYMDESRRGAELSPPSSIERDTKTPQSEDPLSELSGKLWDEGLDAMLSRDYTRALTIFAKAQRLFPGDAKVRANIRRLNQMGYHLNDTEEGAA